MTDELNSGPVPAEGARRASDAGTGAAGPAGLGQGGRMSRKRKFAAVLRLLRGEDLEMVSREFCVTAATLSGWRDAFLAGGEAALVTKEKDSRDQDIERLKAQLGEMLLDRELLKDKIRNLEAGRPLGRRSRR